MLISQTASSHTPQLSLPVVSHALDATKLAADLDADEKGPGIAISANHNLLRAKTCRHGHGLECVLIGGCGCLRNSCGKEPGGCGGRHGDRGRSLAAAATHVK